MASATLERLASTLARHARGVAVKAADVEVLRSPSAFHDRLVRGIAGAKDHVSTSTLYFGTDTEREHRVFQELRNAAKRGVRVRVLCDAPRAGRRGQGKKTIVDHLAHYLGALPAASVSLYQTPRTKGLLKSLVMGRPPYSEILGVCHMKAYVFDDEVLVSGANLNERYVLPTLFLPLPHSL